MKKRLLAILLALVMVCALLPVTVFAADDDFVIVEYEWGKSLQDYRGPGGDVVIPGDVADIAWYAFHWAGLTGVSIPDSVTQIGYGAFYYCTGLTSVVIPDSVTSMGDSAFYGCDSLAKVTIGSGVPSIGHNTFFGCTSLTSIDVAKGNAHYASQDGVLFNKARTELVCCPSGRTGDYTVPDGTTSVGTGAFKNCAELTRLTIPYGVNSIGHGAFEGCAGLTRMAIPDSVTNISISAFWRCDRLTSVTIPPSVTSIGGSAFDSCPRLTIYGETGSYAEQYCAENNIPFVDGVAPGTAQSGTMTSDSGAVVEWDITEEGKVSVSAGLGQDEKVLGACYDDQGRFVGAKWITVEKGDAQVDPATPNVKLFWLGADQNPLSPSVTVWGK